MGMASGGAWRMNKPIPKSGTSPNPPEWDVPPLAPSPPWMVMPKLSRWERVALSFLSKPLRMQCGAKTRAGASCQAPAMPNGRCKLHGGRSTGPLSDVGRERIAAAQRRRWATWRAERHALQP